MRAGAALSARGAAAPVPIPDDIAVLGPRFRRAPRRGRLRLRRPSAPAHSWACDHHVVAPNQAWRRRSACVRITSCSPAQRPTSVGPRTDRELPGQHHPQEFERDFCVPARRDVRRRIPRPLRRHGGSVTRSILQRTYRVRRPPRIPCIERERVETFRELLLAAASGRDEELTGRAAGELMYESHASYSALRSRLAGHRSAGRARARRRSRGRLVRCADHRRRQRRNRGRCSGGRDAAPPIARVVDAYARADGHRPYVFSGSSPGVASCGVSTSICDVVVRRSSDRSRPDFCRRLHRPTSS